MTSPTMQKYKHVKILLGIPSNGMWHADFAMSLQHVMSKCNSVRIGEYKQQSVTIMHSVGSILTKMRVEMALHARDSGADYLLFLDSDHTFPSMLVHRLMSHNVDIVGANCVTKSIPASPTARLLPNAENPWGVPCYSDPDKHGLEKVWRVGTGVLLVSAKVLKAIDIKHSFDMFWNDEADVCQGEDWTFVAAAAKAGFPIHVDHDLSRQVGHIGRFTYTHDYVGTIVKEEIAA